MHFTVKETNPSLYEGNVASLENECNELSETKNDRLLEILSLFSINSEISRDLATRVIGEAKSRRDKVFNKRLLCLIGSRAGPLQDLFCEGMKKEELITLFSSTDRSTAYTIPRSLLSDRLGMSVNGDHLNVPDCSPKTLRELIHFCYCSTLSKDLTDTQFEEIVQLMKRYLSYDQLTSACHFGQFSLVQDLLKKGKGPTHIAKLGISPLVIACQEGHIDIVNLLIDNDADIHQVTNSGTSPLYIACREGHIDILKLLIEKGADIHQARNSGASPLYIACQEGHIDIVNLLIEKGVDIHRVINSGTSPLHIACQAGYIDIVKLLIEKRADIHQTRNGGVSPLYIACQEGHIDIVKLLIEKRADIHQARNSGASPLYIACQEGHIDIVKLLIEKRADIHQASNSGASPLHIACQEGYIDIVNLLIQKGADIHQAINSGASPLSIACLEAHIDIVELLRNQGATALKCGPELPTSQRIDSSLMRWIGLDDYFINMSTRISERKIAIKRALENDGSWKDPLNSFMKSTYSRSTEVRSLLQAIQDKSKLDELEPGTFLSLYEEHMRDVITLEPILIPVRDLDGAGQHSWELQSILVSLDRLSKSPLTKNTLKKTDLRPDWNAIPLTSIYEFLAPTDTEAS